MTGPEHYVAAEELLSQSDDRARRGQISGSALQLVYAAAQVHATLALAAAQIENLNAADEGASPAWIEAVS